MLHCFIVVVVVVVVFFFGGGWGAILGIPIEKRHSCDPPAASHGATFRRFSGHLEVARCEAAVFAGYVSCGKIDM